MSTRKLGNVSLYVIFRFLFSRFTQGMKVDSWIFNFLKKTIQHKHQRFRKSSLMLKTPAAELQMSTAEIFLNVANKSSLINQKFFFKIYCYCV